MALTLTLTHVANANVEETRPNKGRKESGKASVNAECTKLGGWGARFALSGGYTATRRLHGATAIKRKGLFLLICE